MDDLNPYQSSGNITAEEAGSSSAQDSSRDSISLATMRPFFILGTWVLVEFVVVSSLRQSLAWPLKQVLIVVSVSAVILAFAYTRYLWQFVAMLPLLLLVVGLTFALFAGEWR